MLKEYPNEHYFYSEGWGKVSDGWLKFEKERQPNGKTRQFSILKEENSEKWSYRIDDKKWEYRNFNELWDNEFNQNYN